MTFPNPLLTDVPLKEFKRIPVVLDGLVPTDFVAGTLFEFIYAGVLWKRDDADVTSVTDGVTVYVTSDNVRFKNNAITGQSYGYWRVTDFRNAPPSTPTAGDTYGVGTSPTGAFATKGKNIATCLVGGASPIWTFTAPRSGYIAFDRSRGIYMSYTEGGSWIDGLGLVTAVGSIAPEALLVPRITVQSQTSTPPASPSLGQYFLIGAGATGAWVGLDQQVAKCTNATGPVWTTYPASEGWGAWNVATKRSMIFSNSVWADAVRPRIVNYPNRIARASTITTSGTATDQGTAPTTATGAVLFPEGSSTNTQYTLAKSTNRLLLRIRIDAVAFTSAATVGVFVDGEATARTDMWRSVAGTTGVPNSIDVEFEIAVGDVSLHTYTVRIYDASGDTITRAYLQFIEIET